MSMTEPVPEVLTVDEVRTAIEALSEADWVRLDRIAAAHGRNRRLEADDLLQTAFERALDGTRHCPRDVDVVRFLAGAMRSIASDDLKAQRRKPELHLVPKVGGDGFLELDAPDPAPNPEQLVASQQEAERIVVSVLALFDDDLIAQTLIEGLFEEMDVDELLALTGLDKAGYNSKRRFIRRRIDAAFPNGWKS